MAIEIVDLPIQNAGFSIVYPFKMLDVPSISIVFFYVKN
jgi:hypothetical protein